MTHSNDNSDHELDLSSGPFPILESANRFIDTHAHYRIAVWWSPDWNQKECTERMPEWIRKIMLPLDWAFMYRTVFLVAETWKDGLFAPADRGLVLYDAGRVVYLWYGADPDEKGQLYLKELIVRWQKEHTFSEDRRSELLRDAQKAVEKVTEYQQAWSELQSKNTATQAEPKKNTSITDRWVERISEMKTTDRLPFSDRMSVTVRPHQQRTSQQRNHMLGIEIRMFPINFNSIPRDRYDIAHCKSSEMDTAAPYETTFEFLLPKGFPLNPPKMIAPEHLVSKHDFVFGPEPWHPANGLHGYLISALIELFPECMSDARTWFEFTVTPFAD